MPHPVRHATESANISPSTTPDVYIRRWAIKHLKLSILRKEHHPLIKCRFFCLDKGVHLIQSFFNSFLITSVSVVLIVLFGSMAAYAIARRPNKLTRFLRGYFLLGFWCHCKRPCCHFS